MPCADRGGMTSISFPSCFWRRVPRVRCGRSTQDELRKNAQSSQMFAMQGGKFRRLSSDFGHQWQQRGCRGGIAANYWECELWAASVDPSGMGCSDKHPQECRQQGGSTAVDLGEFVSSLSSRCTLHATEPSPCTARKSNWRTKPWGLQCSTQNVPAFAH